jgi:hypothetical protein
MKKISAMIDGGHLRVAIKKANKPFTPDYIEKVGLSCSLATEEIFRILYSLPSRFVKNKPVTGLYAR